MANHEPDYQPDSRITENDLPTPGSSVQPHEPQSDAPVAAPSVDQPPVAPPPKPGAPEPSRTGAHLVDENAESDTPPPSTGQKIGKLFKELLITALITIGIVFVINNFIFQAYYVSGSSMEPNYHNSDYMIIAKWPLTITSIQNALGGKQNLPLQRGDVVVFRYPNAPETFFIKRVIGLPGERVVLKDGVYTIYNQEHPEGFVLQEPYLDPDYKTLGDVDTVVDQQHFFVGGDNRSPGGSFDSREWGQLDQKYITGIAELRLLPLNTFQLLQPPEYK